MKVFECQLGNQQILDAFQAAVLDSCQATGVAGGSRQLRHRGKCIDRSGLLQRFALCDSESRHISAVQKCYCPLSLDTTISCLREREAKADIHEMRRCLENLRRRNIGESALDEGHT